MPPIGSSYTHRPISQTCNAYDKNSVCICNGGKEYKYTDFSNGVYRCCETLDLFPILDAQYTDVKTYLTAYLAEVGDSERCKTFFDTVAALSDSDINSKYPALYATVEIQRKISNEFRVAPTINSTKDTITCSSGVPYMLSYYDGFDENMQNRMVCHTEPFVEIGVEYYAYQIAQPNGLPCTSSTCSTQYDADSGYNTKSEVFASKYKETLQHPIEKWYVWLGVAGGILAILIILILVYRYRHKKSINAMRSSMAPETKNKVDRQMNSYNYSNYQ